MSHELAELLWRLEALIRNRWREILRKKGNIWNRCDEHFRLLAS